MSTKFSKNPFAVSNDAPSLADLSYLHHSRVIHKRRLRDTKSTIDNSAPREFPHQKYNAKQEQMQRERHERIHKENMQMVSKMRSLLRPSKNGVSVSQKPNEVSLLNEITKEAPPAPTLHGIARAIKNAQINEENDRMYHRQVNVPPVHQRKVWRANAEEKKRRAGNVCRFPYQDPQGAKTSADMDVLLEFGVIQQEEYTKYKMLTKESTLNTTSRSSGSSSSNRVDTTSNSQEAMEQQKQQKHGDIRSGSRTQQRRLEYLQAHNSTGSQKNQFKSDSLELPTTKSRAWRTAHLTDPVKAYPHSRVAREANSKAPLNPVHSLSVGQQRGLFKGLPSPSADQIKGKYQVSGIPCSVIVSHAVSPKSIKIRILELLEYTLFEAVLPFDLLHELGISIQNMNELANQLLHGCSLADTNGVVELCVDVHGEGELNPEEICHVHQTTSYDGYIDDKGSNNNSGADNNSATSLPSIRRTSSTTSKDSDASNNVPDLYHNDPSYTGTYVSHHNNELGKPYQQRLPETLDGVAQKDTSSHYFNELQAHKAAQLQKQEKKTDATVVLDEPSFVDGLLALETLADDVAFDAHTTKMSKLERVQQQDDDSQDPQKRRGSTILAKPNTKPASEQSTGTGGGGRRGSVVTSGSGDAMFFNNLSNINLNAQNSGNSGATGKKKKKDTGDSVNNNSNTTSTTTSNTTNAEEEPALNRFSRTNVNNTFKSLAIPQPEHLQDDTFDYTYRNDYSAQRDYSSVMRVEEAKRQNALEAQIGEVVQTAKDDPHGMLSLRVQASCFNLCDRCTFYEETRCPHHTTAVHLYSRQGDDDDEEDNEWLYADQCTEPSFLNCPIYVQELELVFRPKTNTQFAFSVSIATGNNAGDIIGTAAINSEHMLEYRDVELILIDDKGHELKKSIYLIVTSVEYMQG